VLANGEIDVLDPAGYGPLTMNFGGVSIQAHGFAGISQPASCGTCAAITINLINGDPVSLNGLLLDGSGTGTYGILIKSGQSVQILNSVVRHFQRGILDNTSTNGSNLLIEDTIVSDNSVTGIVVNPIGANLRATLNRITANNNQFGIDTANADMTIANSVLSNSSFSGLENDSGVTWLAKNVISGNSTGVLVNGGTVNSYGDNYIRDNGTPVSGGSLTPVGMQ
jgi:hypothetical protein